MFEKTKLNYHLGTLCKCAKLLDNPFLFFTTLVSVALFGSTDKKLARRSRINQSKYPTFLEKFQNILSTNFQKLAIGLSNTLLALKL